MMSNPLKRRRWIIPSKDCQSECCEASAKDNGFSKRSKLQNGRLVLYKEPSDIICRVSTCRLYGKAVKSFLTHLSSHNLTWEQHCALPPTTLRQQYILTKTSSEWMKYRKPELCFVPRCKLEHRVYLTELVKHLRKEHSLSRDEYRDILKDLTLKDFNGHCPSMIEEIEESAMEEAAKFMGVESHRMPLCLDTDDPQYPSLRMFHLDCSPDSHGVASFDEGKLSMQLEKNRQHGSIRFLGRKRIMSPEHAMIFEKSIASSSMWIYNRPDITWLKYDCGVCGHVHTLDIIFVNMYNLPKV